MTLPSFHPEHLADLRRSGLVDDSIVKAGLYSARPGDLGRLTGRDLPDGSSGLVFPYDHDFARVKIFPPLADAEGRTIKYLQRPGSPVRLYTVPLRLLDDPAEILADPSIPLRIVEGEKKALALVQAGFPAVAIGGIYNFRAKGLPPDRLIDDLEAIAWAGRLAYLVPDSDLTTNEHVLKAVFTLARLLEARGARVLIVKLPAGADGAKVGADDFLVARGDLGRPAWRRLEQRALTLAAPLFRELREQERAAKRDVGTDGRPDSIATTLVKLAKAAGVELFRSPDGEAYMTVPVEGHRETWRIRSTGARRWLARAYFEAAEKAPGSQAVQDAIGVLEGQALFAGAEHPVWTRVAEHDGKLYLDLADARWRAVEIDATGWRIVQDVPVKFRRTRGMLPLPEPIAGGSLEALFDFLNVHDEAARTLVVAWLLATYRPNRPFPALFLYGEQGAAKTTTGRALRRLVDPNKAELRSEPRDARDLMIAAQNGWIVALDNLSSIAPGLSDDLCRLATGGGFGTRELYSDDEEKLFDAMRPVLVTGIEELATRPDLLDRALLVELPPIPEGQRRPEAAFWADFEAERPAILGALLDAVACALRRLPEVRLDRLPRMADFTLWAEAAAPALGWAPGALLATYRSNRAAANDLALEGAPVVEALRALLDADPSWTGTAGELLTALAGHVSDSTTKLKAWPATPRGLSGLLRRLAPNLRAAGIEVEFFREAGGRTGTRARMISIRRSDGTSTDRTVPTVPTVPSAAESQASGGTVDGGHRPSQVTDRPYGQGEGRSGVSGGTVDDSNRPSVSTRYPTGRDGRDGRDDGAPPSLSPPLVEAEEVDAATAARAHEALRKRTRL